jgi:hypothetical protein
MTDINPPVGTLTWSSVDKAITGENGSTNVGKFAFNTDTSFGTKQAITISDTVFAGVYEWKNYKNQQNLLDDLRFPFNNEPQGHVFSNSTNTRIIHSGGTGIVAFNASDDNWETKVQPGLSIGFTTVYTLGNAGDSIAVGFNDLDIRAYNFNGTDFDAGNIVRVGDAINNVHVRGLAMSEDGTRLAVGYEDDTGNFMEHIRVYSLTSNTIGSQLINKSTRYQNIEVGDFYLTHNGDYIIGIYGFPTKDSIRFSTTANSSPTYTSIHSEGEVFSDHFKVTNVYPQGKSYSLPMISFVATDNFVRFYHPTDTGSGYDMNNMVMHGKIALSSLPTGALWAQPISFTEMVVGGEVNGVGYLNKMDYTPLGPGF